ncbi:MAG: protein translocase subunit SecF, partial [Acidobacteriia bacterium]|nr:protein translocase subunit SecF [Terriglobia bacterium]
MELFKNTNFDFLGKKWRFIGLSLVLTVAGLASIALKGGLRYGIDFRGGALMTVQFAYNPPLDKIRTAMSKAVKGEVSVENFTDSKARNQVQIGTELQSEGVLNQNRTAMEQVLRNTFGQSGSDKIDFNNTGKDLLASQLRDPLARNNVPISDQELQRIVNAAKDY